MKTIKFVIIVCSLRCLDLAYATCPKVFNEVFNSAQARNLIFADDVKTSRSHWVKLRNSELSQRITEKAKREISDFSQIVSIDFLADDQLLTTFKAKNDTVHYGWFEVVYTDYNNDEKTIYMVEVIAYQSKTYADPKPDEDSYSE